MNLLIIADDLTGSLDTGVQLAKKGITTEVRLQGAEGEDAGTTSVVVDTESRHISPEEAFVRVREAARWGKAAGAAGFYKKTDSTLRGNIGAELAGLIAGVEEPSAMPLVFVPAFPALKRTTRRGTQYVDGVSLEKTDFAKDRLNPMRTANIAQIIADSARAGTLAVKSAVPKELTGIIGRGGASVVVVDGETEQDLAQTSRQILAAAGDVSGLPLMAGCAGFAAYLPELLGIIPKEPPVPQLPRPFLAINGSLSPVSLAQIRAAAAAGLKNIRIEPTVLRSISCGLSAAEFAKPTLFHAMTEHVNSCTEKITDFFRQSGAALLYNILYPEEVEVFNNAATAAGIPEENVHEVLPQSYGEIVRALTAKTEVGTLVVFGGDTLVGILKALGKSSVIPLAEIFPGVVAARIPGIDNPRYIVTKAGGFGGEDLLRKIIGI